MGKNNKSKQYASYKRLASVLETQIVWKWRDGKGHFEQMVAITTKASVAIFTSEKKTVN